MNIIEIEFLYPVNLNLKKMKAKIFQNMKHINPIKIGARARTKIDNR